MAEPTHYDILGIPPDVGRYEIHRAYVYLLTAIDEGHDGSREMEVFRARAEMAYKVLSNPDSRTLYDVELRAKGMMPQPPARGLSRLSRLLHRGR